MITINIVYIFCYIYLLISVYDKVIFLKSYSSHLTLIFFLFVSETKKSYEVDEKAVKKRIYCKEIKKKKDSEKIFFHKQIIKK